MIQLDIALATIGAVVLALGVISQALKRSPLQEPLIAVMVGIAVGPAGLGWLDIAKWGDPILLLETAARLTLAIALMGVALRLERRDIVLLWRPVGFILLLGMLGMWAISSSIIGWWLGLPLWMAVTVGAAVTPTDPVVASAIVTGRFAEEHLQTHIQDSISLESGANDGLAFLLVMVPILALTAGPWEAAQRWLIETLLVGVIVATAIGVGLGWGAARLLHFVKIRGLIESYSFLTYTVALSLFTLGAATLMGADALISVFAVGLAFNLEEDAVGIIVILVVGVGRIADGALTPGDLVRVTYLLSLLAVPIRLIGYVMWDTANSVAGWTRVADVLAVDDVVRHGDVPAASAGTAATVDADRVRFGYGQDGPPVLVDLDLTIPAGRTIAVVGPTGSGKSTLALLLARLWDPDDGAIRLDARDLRELAPGAVATEVAYVSQGSFLFDDDVRGNVTLGDDLDDARVEEALRLAGATDFVAALPHGLDTRLGERGTTLSGGQQQRLALARALARRPRLLVLDDATSAVDPTVEAAILRGLQRADLPSTVVVVAYRRSSIVLADEVVHVDDGRVVAHGTHEQLLRSEPGYAALLQAYEVDQAARDHERAQQAAEDTAPGPGTEGRV
jgi:ATP-binding cassette, subfamily B, bacterial